MVDNYFYRSQEAIGDWLHVKSGSQKVGITFF